MVKKELFPPRHIFREYDIRGLAGEELTDETAELIGRAFGRLLIEEERGQETDVATRPAPEAHQEEPAQHPAKPIEKAERPLRIAVGHDLRPSSTRLQRALIEGLVSAGADVLDLGLIPTPLLYFGIVHFKQDAGISITGSHNPPEYNGFKFQLAERPFYGADIRRLAEWIDSEAREKEGTGGRGEGDEREEGEGHRKQRSGKETRGRERSGEGKAEGGVAESGRERVPLADAIPPYLAALKQQFHFSKPWKIVIDSGHGMSGLVAPCLFRELDQDLVELYTNLDPTFPDHHPDPAVPENLKDLQKKVREVNANLGIAFDGDADRIGVVDEKGEIVASDRLLILYARQVLKRQKGAKIIGDVKCSPILYEEIRKLGGIPILWKTGHSLIKAKMKEEKAALGGELSGHMFFRDRWYGFDDALYAACRIVEILDEEKRPLSQLLAGLPRVFSTPEIRIPVSDDQKKFEIVRSVVADLKRDHEVIDLDGARVEFADGWGLIRASNTQPVLVMRFEAQSEKRLAEIRALIEGKIKKYA